MNENHVRYSFGPVPSRRLGRSLGVNNIPPKACTYSCAYCQIGRTTAMHIDRRSFYRAEDVVRDVRRRVEAAKHKGISIDYLTFVPDGEPTLDLHLGEEIALLKSLGIPLGVITNSSLLWRDDVREALARADWVSLKVDAVQETIWRAINRPHKKIQLTAILDGMREFAKTYAGKLATETMLVEGYNDSDRCLKEIASLLHTIRPAVAYISVPTRPPAEPSIRTPREEILIRAHQIFCDSVRQVEYLIGYEGDDVAATGDVEKDLLSITAVHPLKQEAVRKLLAQGGAVWAVVDRLIVQGDLSESFYEGEKFYLRIPRTHTTEKVS